MNTEINNENFLEVSDLVLKYTLCSVELMGCVEEHRKIGIFTFGNLTLKILKVKNKSFSK